MFFLDHAVQQGVIGVREGYNLMTIAYLIDALSTATDLMEEKYGNCTQRYV